MAQSDSNNSSQEVSSREPPKLYECKYCHCKFSSTQALGGHQNAHKKLRAREKNAQGFGSQTSSNVICSGKLSTEFEGYDFLGNPTPPKPYVTAPAYYYTGISAGSYHPYYLAAPTYLNQGWFRPLGGMASTGNGGQRRTGYQQVNWDDDGNSDSLDLTLKL